MQSVSNKNSTADKGLSNAYKGFLCTWY